MVLKIANLQGNTVIISLKTRLGSANLFAIWRVRRSRALGRRRALLIVLEADSSLALGIRFHVFFLVLSEKRFACIIGHCSTLTVPGAAAIRTDSMRFEEARKPVEVQGAKSGSQYNNEVDCAKSRSSAHCKEDW